MTGRSYAGSGDLARLGLRRDRALAGFGILAPGLALAASAKATMDLYPPGTKDLSSLVAVFESPAARALYGAVADPENIDALAVVKAQLMGMVMLMSVLFAMVRRHTRGDEESGRLELIGGTAIGRRAPLAGASLQAVTVLVLSCAVTIAGLVATGLDPVGSLAFGVGWFGLGLATVGVTAVAAQVFSSTRVVGVAVAGVLGVGYLLRAVADVSADLAWLRWFTPFGWNEEVSAYGQNRLWVGLVPVLVAVLLLILAFTLRDRRDLGGALIAERAGPATAPPGLRSPLALAWRTQRGTFLAWLVGLVAVGTAVGSMSASVTDVLASGSTADLFARMGINAGTLLDTFFAAFVKFIGVYAAGYGVLTLLRLHTEEDAGRLEPVLATANSRTGVLAAHASLALTGTAVLTVAGGLALGVAGAIGLHDGSNVLRLLLASLGAVPSGLAMVAIAALLIGWAPRWAVGTWAVFATAFFTAEFGRLVGLPERLVTLSPFDHVPSLPGGSVSRGSLIAMLILGAILLILGDMGFRRRDVT
ncbi:MAG: ABC transporter permease [Nostocoides sp.]